MATLATCALLLALPGHAPDVADDAEAEKSGEAHGVIGPAPTYGPRIHGRATHYGWSYHGQRMANGQPYSSYDPSIVAVGPARYAQWPLGTVLEISGPAGVIETVVQDRCPGCSATMVDLSEAGSSAVCGGSPMTCSVSIREVLQ